MSAAWVFTRPYQWPESYYQVPIAGTYPPSYAKLPVCGTTYLTVYSPTAQVVPFAASTFPVYSQPVYYQPQIWYPAYIF